jgi:hypothetical protein
VAPLSIRRLLRRSHPAGLCLGIALFGLAVALAVPPLWAASRVGWNLHRALAGPAAAPAARYCFYAALTCPALGSWLITRWHGATHR